MEYSLLHGITESDTELQVTNTISDVNNSGVLTIESETIYFTHVSDSQFLGLTRGANGTTAATHAAKKVITVVSINPSGTTEVVRGYKDNAASLRVSGVDINGKYVQSYSGVYHNDSYDTNGLLDTRFITGGNEDMDLEIQSSNALLISAVGENTSGFAKIAARTNVVFNLRDEADQDSPKQLILDRVDTGTVGSANTSDVNVTVNAGNLRLLSGNLTGTVVLPTLTTTEVSSLTPVEGMLAYDSTNHKVTVYNGSSWKVVTFDA